MDNLVENLKISEVAEIVKEKLEIAKSKMNQEFASNVEPKNGVYGDSEKFEQEKVECPYSDEILDCCFPPPEQLKVLTEQKLEEGKVGDRKALKMEIDLNKEVSRLIDGIEVVETNHERMKQGLAPYGDDNKPIELHHVGQSQDSPLAELTNSVHRREHSNLHVSQSSKIDRKLFAKERSDYWKERAKEYC